jgi:hypothetical protein
MGMAMTILSFSMLARFAGINVRQLKPSDLDPAKVWAEVDDRIHRGWARAVKLYESMRLVYEVRSRLSELSVQEQAAPAKASPPQAAPAEMTPTLEPPGERRTPPKSEGIRK